jgi:predicted RNase H-like HicB family nuclease
MNEALRYAMIIYWSADDDSFVVEIPELPGCMADGRTPEEALANAQAIAREWIETAISLGRDVPRPRGRLTFA